MATYNTAFGSLPGYNEMLGTTNTTGGGQQQTYGQTSTTTTTAAPAAGAAPAAPAPTFRDLQAAGQARPAPPLAPTQAPPSTLTEQLKQQLGSFLQQPGRFGTQEFQQIRQAQAANLQAEYGAQQQQLNEELARRGLSASSVGGGRMGDLAGQQARALASLDATLLEKAAGYGAEDLKTKLEAIGLLQKGSEFEQTLGLRKGELTGTLGGEETLQAKELRLNLEEKQQSRLQQLGLSTRELDLRATQIQNEAKTQGRSLDLQEARDAAEIEYRVKQLDQQARLEGRSLDLQEARDIAAREIEVDRLAAQERQFDATLTAEEKRFNASLKEQQENRLQQLGISTRELDLQALKIKQDAATQGRTLDLQEARDEAEIQYRTKALEQEATLQGRTLDLQQARDLAEQGFREDTLKEQTAARLQQLGISTKQLDETVRQNKASETLQGRSIDNEKLYRDAELKLRSDQLQKDAANQGRAMDIDEARIAAQKAMQVEELKFNREDLAERKRQFGERIAEDKRQADLDRQLRQMLGLTEATGTVYTAGEGGAVTATGTKTLAALKDNLEKAQVMSAITGRQYTVDANGNVVTTSTEPTEAARQANLDRDLRKALGMSEATGYVYDPVTGAKTSDKTVQGQIAGSQILLSLASALGNLTPEQIAQLFGKAPPTTQAGDTTTTRSSGTTTTSLANPKDGDTKTEGGKNYVYRGVWPTGQWVEQTTSITTTTTDIKPTQPTTTTTKATENTTTTTKDPMATTPLLDRQQQQINDVLAGPAFDGRYQYVTGINGWAVYKGGKWYAYNAAPPVQPVVVNGQQTNVYPGWTGIDFSNNVRIMWDGVKFVAL